MIKKKAEIIFWIGVLIYVMAIVLTALKFEVMYRLIVLGIGSVTVSFALALKNNNIIEYKWVRNLFPSVTFILLEFEWLGEKKWKWYDKVDYDAGLIIVREEPKTTKVVRVEGKWHSQFFCDCDNELFHSGSQVGSIKETKNGGVLTFKCKSCGTDIYGNVDIIPGLMRCDEKGTPICSH